MAADDWGADEEDEEMDDDEEQNGAGEVEKPKKKTVSSEPKVKKAHMNIIFIGHVGRYFQTGLHLFLG